MISEKKLQDAVKAVVETVHRLRAPNGCPWDREQTHLSLRPYLIEEAYETLEVLDRVDKPDSLKNERIRAHLQEELGDVLLQVLLHAQLADETGAFDFADVASGLNDKLVRRHPHVFGDAAKTDSTDSVLMNWERLKAEEKSAKAAKGENPSVLDGLPKALPTLQRTERMIEKVSRVGFQWPNMDGPLAKVLEEYSELKHELEAEKRGEKPDPQKIENELGDVLFSICNLAFMSKVHPEDALRSTLSRFESRFRHVEDGLRLKGKTPQQSNLEEMDVLWNEAKAKEQTQEKK